MPAATASLSEETCGDLPGLRSMCIPQVKGPVVSVSSEVNVQALSACSSEDTRGDWSRVRNTCDSVIASSGEETCGVGRI